MGVLWCLFGVVRRKGRDEIYEMRRIEGAIRRIYARIDHDTQFYLSHKITHSVLATTMSSQPDLLSIDSVVGKETIQKNKLTSRATEPPHKAICAPSRSVVQITYSLLSLHYITTNKAIYIFSLKYNDYMHGRLFHRKKTRSFLGIAI